MTTATLKAPATTLAINNPRHWLAVLENNPQCAWACTDCCDADGAIELLEKYPERNGFKNSVTLAGHYTAEESSALASQLRASIGEREIEVRVFRRSSGFWLMLAAQHGQAAWHADASGYAGKE